MDLAVFPESFKGLFSSATNWAAHRCGRQWVRCRKGNMHITNCLAPNLKLQFPPASAPPSNNLILVVYFTNKTSLDAVYPNRNSYSTWYIPVLLPLSSHLLGSQTGCGIRMPLELSMFPSNGLAFLHRSIRGNDLFLLQPSLKSCFTQLANLSSRRKRKRRRCGPAAQWLCRGESIS